MYGLGRHEKKCKLGDKNRREERREIGGTSENDGNTEEKEEGRVRKTQPISSAPQTYQQLYTVSCKF